MMGNREIRFRAWDNREGIQRMYYNVSFIPYGEGWEGGNPEYKFYQIFHGNGSFFLADMANIELMQYTQLKDKNGKEIYEGDIVLHFGNISEAPGLRHEVEFHRGAFGYVTEQEFISYAGNRHFTLKNNSSPEIEIIGNIFQNEKNTDA